MRSYVYSRWMGGALPRQTTSLALVLLRRYTEPRGRHIDRLNSHPDAGEGLVATHKKNGAERRTDILNSMEELLVEAGISGFSMRRLADKVGISLASLQYHFSSKDVLMSSFLEFKFTQLHEQMNAKRRDDERDPLTALRERLHEIIELDRRPSTNTLYTLLWALAASDPAIADAMNEHTEMYINSFYEAVRVVRPDWDERRSRMTATFIVSTLEGFATTHAATASSGLPPTQIADFVVDALMRSVTTRA